jgi:hypothetical protein
MNPLTQEPLPGPSITQRYFTRFGRGGEFEGNILPGNINEELMADALRRGRPVTEADIRRAIRKTYGDLGPPGDLLPPDALT